MSIINEQYITIAKAAELLRVSKSTLWRWIKEGALPAYRLGSRRVLIKQEDLDKLITPVREKKEEDSWEKERERLAMPLTEEEKKQGLAALESAKKFSAEMLKRRGGELFSDSTEIIREMREERTRQLS